VSSDQTEPETVTVAVSILQDMREANILLRRREKDMRELIGTHIAKGLASRDGDRWTAAIELSKALDAVACNVDRVVDQWLEDHGWDPRSAYKSLASLASNDDPWAPRPDITPDIPEPVRRIVTERLAGMLLDRQDDWHVEQARRFAFALKAEDADLTPDIEKRITELTLGRDPSDPPF